MNPKVNIKYRSGEPPYVEIWTDEGMILHGWVHDDPWPAYEFTEDEEEEELEEEEEEELAPIGGWGRIILTQEEIVDPPLFESPEPQAVSK